MDLGGMYRKIYFLGIGGVHMSGLAELCMLEGFKVSGSDARDSAAVSRLRNLDMTVFVGHDESNIDSSIDLVVRTSAVKPENPELIQALRLGIPVIDRAALLSRVMENYENVICVSGSHGKTTCTTMISEILMATQKNPTIMNGGICPSINATMKRGGRELFVAEADEYCDAFLAFKPRIGVILNIDMDHSDYFKDYEALRTSFKKFAVASDVLVINGNIDNYEDLIPVGKPVITFGNDRADWTAKHVEFNEYGLPSFNVLYKGKPEYRISLGAPGMHNVQNALAAIAVCKYLGLSMEEIAPVMLSFKGAIRRFEHKGMYNGAYVIDDYAHHPTEINATLTAARQAKALTGRLICIFQPHTRSRTIELFEDFVTALEKADIVVLMDIFTPAGREENHIPVSSKDLAGPIRKRGRIVTLPESFDDAVRYLSVELRPGDMAITMGAGDVYKIADILFGRV